MGHRIVVTGGCGFIGSNFLSAMVRRCPDWTFVNVDSLTYAANPQSLEDVAGSANYRFERMDICDAAAIRGLFAGYDPHWVFHFAAESHVDRSIHAPQQFLSTNVMGTLTLLEACRAQWRSCAGRLFHHVSTDEVYGSLGPRGYFTESTAYDPSSPYSASKAASDHLVRAFHKTYGLPVKITNCSNNYGPRQFPEKLIPLMILNALEGKPLPVYGDGRNVRDWLYVADHCEAILQVALRGRIGETYNIGGSCERSNLEVVQAICDSVAAATGGSSRELLQLITFVPDRPGHDLRYAIDAARIRSEVGWAPVETFHSGLEKTVRWYLENPRWIENVRNGEYRKWIEINYGERTSKHDPEGDSPGRWLRHAALPDHTGDEQAAHTHL